MWCATQGTYYSETGDAYLEIDNEDKNLFQVKDSAFSTNSTRTNRGLIPGLLYKI